MKNTIQTTLVLTLVKTDSESTEAMLNEDSKGSIYLLKPGLAGRVAG